MLAVKIPDGAMPGSQFYALHGAQQLLVTVPAGAAPGQTINIQIQPEAHSGYADIPIGLPADAHSNYPVAQPLSHSLSGPVARAAYPGTHEAEKIRKKELKKLEKMEKKSKKTKKTRDDKHEKHKLKKEHTSHKSHGPVEDTIFVFDTNCFVSDMTVGTSSALSLCSPVGGILVVIFVRG